jgi:hypothetical protein
MTPQRPQRVRKPKVIWQAVEDTKLSTAEKAVEKAPRTNKKTAIEPILLEPLPSLIERPLPSYTPPFEIRKKIGRPTFSDLSPIETFKRFICVNIIALIVSATNSYAENHDANRPREETPYSRTWKLTTLGEIYRYIGVWLYMGMHSEPSRAFYWSESHRLGRYLSRNRFDQIHRYFSTRNENLDPRQSNEGFAWKLGPISAILRVNIFRNWSPGTYVAVDEAMIAFRGRTLHKVKMKNKPIDEGYKTWMTA